MNESLDFFKIFFLYPTLIYILTLRFILPLEQGVLKKRKKNSQLRIFCVEEYKQKSLNLPCSYTYKKMELFKDLNKPGNDLLTKGFPSSDGFSHKVQLDTKSDGAKFLTKASQNLDGKISASVEHKTTSKGLDVTTTFKSDGGYSTKGEKKINSDVKVDVEVAAKMPFNNPVFTTNLEVKKEKFSLTSKTGVPMGGNPTLAFSFLAKLHDKICFGGDSAYNVQGGLKNTGHTVGFRFNGGDYKLVAQEKTAKSGQSFLLSYYQKRATMNVAAQAVYTSDNIKVEIGGEKNLAKDLSGKAKFNTSGVLGVSLKHKVSAALAVTYGGEFDLNKSGSNKANVCLNFNA